jgi:hypothetical protein
MIQRLLRMKNKSWAYSFISLLNVGCGLAVTGLIWYRYSASQQSDILLLATSSISILAQLSLVGVEQVLYFYTDESKKGREVAAHFMKLAFTWALISGAGFAVLFILFSKYFLMMVASGFSEENQELARYVILCLTPQLLVSPALHVIRGKWALEEKFGRAYMLSAVNSLVLLLCLLLTVITGVQTLKVFSNLSLGVYIAFLAGFLFYNRRLLIWPAQNEWHKIKMLVIHSSSIKGANAVHNFLVQALISSLLSQMPTGSISIFQYAKRLADGVFAITAGPQVMIYHSRCAKAISSWNLTDMRANVVHFLKTFLSLFFAMAAVVYLLTPFALSIVGKNFLPETVSEILLIYLGIVLWYLIMGIETLSVGVLLATHSSRNLFAVNLTFILLFFTWSRGHNITSVLELILTTVAFQLVSFGLFTWSAFRIINRRGLSAS